MPTKQIFGPVGGWIQNGAIIPAELKHLTLVGLADADANPTAAQLVNSSYFTMTAGAARAFNTPTAANIVAAFVNPTIGTWFKFYIVNLAVGAFAITVTDPGGIGITLTGQMAVAQNENQTFLGLITNVAVPAVTIVMA